MALTGTLERLNSGLLKIARNPVIDSGDLKAALGFIVEEAAHRANVERVSVWRYNDDKTKIICMDLYEKSIDRHSSGLELTAADYPAYFECMARERVLMADDARRNPNTQQFTDSYLTPNGITSMMDASILLSGEMIGVLCNEHVGPLRHWTLRDHYFAGVLTEIIARAFAARERKTVQDDLVRINSHLEQVNQKLAQTNQQKDELLMMVSHELKTPLNVISGWTDLLRTDEMPPERVSQAYDAILRSVQAQTHIIDDLLDTSRIILGRLVLKKASIDLVAVIHSSISSARLMAEKKNLEITVQDQVDRAAIYGDVDRIRQVFDNLLSNAIKHTPSGGRISVTLEQRDRQCAIEIQDNGEGISAPLLPTIFNRFSQGDTSVTRSHGGLGLGLAIAKHLVESHGGRISAFSAGKGQGATFTVTFPLLTASGPASFESAVQPGDEEAMPTNPLKDIRLLVVDDEPDSRYLAKILLSDQGGTVETAASAEEALRELQTFKPNLVMCDLAMPVEDGFALIRKIRSGAAPGFENIPAIALSALTDNASQNQAATAGFQDFVTKPFNIQSCVNAIVRVLRRQAA